MSSCASEEMTWLSRTGRACVVVGALLVTCVTFASTARADPPSRAPASAAESREYQHAIRSALEEFDAGNYPEARALFTQAHELSPNARTYRGLGFVAFELRNYGECVEYLEASLRSTDKTLNANLRRTTEDLLARARGLIARVHMDVSPRMDMVLVDGVPVEVPEGRTLVLEVGDHMVELRASGYVSERRALKIAGGEEVRLSVAMRASEPSAPAAGPRLAQDTGSQPLPRQDAPPPRPLYKNPWLWTAVAVVAVGAGVGAYFLFRPDPAPEARAPATTGNTPPGGVVQALGSW